MRKLLVVQRICTSGLVAIVRTTGAGDALRIAEACAEAGVAALEVTFTVPGAAGVLEQLTKHHEPASLAIGAGTVLDPETARIAILSGAEFLVGPSLSPGVARMAGRYQIPYMPGAGTVAEVIAGMEAGAAIIKVFPGEVLGPAFLKAVRGPLPHAPLMPTGGVSLDNAAEWIRAGAVALGVGGNLTSGAKSGDFGSITTMARRFLEEIRKARGM
jgi:2-dehydro-3-deoxyphosphogluconate aldolase/(4S)-4-hydroxy-2-oxoglutarate aldolase